MRRANQNQSFDIPVEFCGQGVGVESVVNVKHDGTAFVHTKIKDGTRKEIGQFALRDEGDKVFLDLSGIKDMKRRTLVNVLGKLKEHVENALAEQLTAESDEVPANENAGDGEAAEAPVEE